MNFNEFFLSQNDKNTLTAWECSQVWNIKNLRFRREFDQYLSKDYNANISMLEILSGKTTWNMFFTWFNKEKIWISNKIKLKPVQIININKIKFWFNFQMSFCSSFPKIIQIKTLKFLLCKTQQYGIYNWIFSQCQRSST